MSRSDWLQDQNWVLANWRLVAALVWIVVTVTIAGVAVLKPTTTAGDLGFLPVTCVRWLDKNYDLRTLIMLLGILCPPAALLWSSSWNATRRRLLSLIVVILIVLECLQLWIPTRGFSFADLAYTGLGGVLTEILVILTQLIVTIEERNLG